MNSKHRKTLAVVFTDPVSGAIEWASVESLLLAAGARLIEGNAAVRPRTVVSDPVMHPGRKSPLQAERAADRVCGR